jgi:hypothetical protein
MINTLTRNNNNNNNNNNTMSTNASDVQAMLMTKPVTRIHGRPEIEDIDTLEKEVARIVAMAKTSLFPQGRKYGHLAMIVGQTAYRNTILDHTFVYTSPPDPGAYDSENIVGAVATNAASRAQAEAKHKRKQLEYLLFIAVESAARQHIVEAVDEELMVEKYDEFIEYEGNTPAELIEFLRDNVCLASTTADQTSLQAKLMEPWDQTTNILSYFTKLDKAQVAMVKAHVPCADAAKAIQAAAQMDASNIFSEEQIIGWEEKAHTDKTWADLKTYFTAIYKSKMQYSKGEARRNGPESVNAMRTQETQIREELEQFMETLQQKTTTENEAINELKEDQKTFVTLGQQLVDQMKKQQETIDKMSRHMDSNERGATNNQTGTQGNSSAQGTIAADDRNTSAPLARRCVSTRKPTAPRQTKRSAGPVGRPASDRKRGHGK